MDGAPGLAGLSCSVLMVVTGYWFVEKLKWGTISPFPCQLTPTLLVQDSTPVSWRLNAESIQLHHPPLHLMFQRTHISSLRCQTFSTCYFALVPQAMSIPLLFQKDGLGEVGQQRLMLKWGWGWGWGQRTAIHFWHHWLRVLHVMTCCVKVKGWNFSTSLHWFVASLLLRVIALVIFKNKELK